MLRRRIIEPGTAEVAWVNDGQMYGRTEVEWADLEAAGWDFLFSRARQPYPVTTYTEVNAVLAHRTGQPPWNFDLQKDRAAMGELLGRLANRSCAETKDHPGGGLMISALCMYLDQNEVGRGFYGKAVKLQLIPSERLPTDVKDAFWIKQMNGVAQWAASLEPLGWHTGLGAASASMLTPLAPRAANGKSGQRWAAQLRYPARRTLLVGTCSYGK
jgi:hypothetical protein